MARRDARKPVHRAAGGAGTGASAVRAALQGYADRGVFRGLHVAERAGGRLDCEFVWLLGRPMRATFDSRASRLVFPALLPGADPKSDMVKQLRSMVTERETAAVPAHKRVDRRRAQLECTVARTELSLAVRVRGANHEYAVRRALNLVNEMFLLLHASYPDYLVERFGLSTE